MGEELRDDRWVLIEPLLPAQSVEGDDGRMTGVPSMAFSFGKLRTGLSAALRCSLETLTTLVW
jgi:hypothetical protein